MKLGIMQPYFFPYLGYWQLINAVDEYVIYDDVNYIKRGWINRNRILDNNGGVMYFNVILDGASQNKHINEICVNTCKKEIEKQIKTIKTIYSNAKFFLDAFPVIESILDTNECNLARYNTNLIKKICEYLEIDTRIHISSEIAKNNELKGEAKIVNICKTLGATEYYNAIGGRDFYIKEIFDSAGIELKFLKTNPIIYKQFNPTVFHSDLSIIDVMMFNSKDQIKEFLAKCELVGI